MAKRYYINKVSKKHSVLLGKYNKFLRTLPDEVRCAACGGLSRSERMEPHHPAGRTPASYCFVFLLHPACHRRCHAHSDWAEENGLLWRGRNRKTLTKRDMRELVSMCPHPPTYALKQPE